MLMNLDPEFLKCQSELESSSSLSTSTGSSSQKTDYTQEEISSLLTLNSELTSRILLAWDSIYQMKSFPGPIEALSILLRDLRIFYFDWKK